MPSELHVSGTWDEAGCSEFEAFDAEMYTKGLDDVRYVKALCPVETGLRLLKEAGYEVTIEVSK